MRAAPVASLADLIVAVLERGLCLVIRLDGPPGDRRLLLGVGLAEAASPLVMALCASGLFESRDYGAYDDYDPAEFDDHDEFGWA